MADDYYMHTLFDLKTHLILCVSVRCLRLSQQSQLYGAKNYCYNIYVIVVDSKKFTYESAFPCYVFLN